MNRQKTALIIGAGPAGLTAALELLKRTDIKPIVLEKDTYLGGLSRTVCYHGNRIDIGGHRFFSKSDRVMQWWLEQLPMQSVDTPDEVTADDNDRVMLVRQRRSRIYYQRKFFNYPINLSIDTLRKLGLWRVAKMAMSYFRSMLLPIRNVETLEDFFINRFGRELYHTFFESYTEKVWGKPCSEIPAEWGAQRIKGLSISKAVWHMLKKPFAGRDVSQKDVETSLIEQFFYPKHGPGQMWECVAQKIKQSGGEVLTNMEVQSLDVGGKQIVAVEAIDSESGKLRKFQADYVFSTMPIKQLIGALATDVPQTQREVAAGLVYRDFITVGLLLDDFKIKEKTKQGSRLIRDNWIYIQESDVQVGRLQIFNNWSPYLLADRSKIWVGLEYFCNEHDDLWVQPDRKIVEMATEEFSRIGFIEPSAVLDATVIRMPKTYPAYFGTYDRFDELREWLDQFENLFLIGRNGMHRYNNMDHSMLTAMVAVDNVLDGRADKSNIWSVNAEQEYHETRSEKPQKRPEQVAEPEQEETPVAVS